MTVESVNTAAYGNAGTAEDKAQQFINSLTDLLTTTFDVDVPTAPFSYFQGGAEFNNLLSNKPSITGDTTFSGIENPGDIESYTIRDPEDIPIPSFDLGAPEVNLPKTPTLVLPTLPADPTINEVETPDSPSISLPTSPTLASVELPSAPSVEFPEFSKTFPVEPDLLLRTDTFDYVNEEYDSELKDELYDKLLDDVMNGGYGIEPADENALWQRAKDREYGNLRNAEMEVYDQFAARGFKVPPGALMSAQHKAQKETRDRVNELNREIVVTRADLFRKTREFAISKGAEFDNSLMTYFGFEQERKLNASRIMVETSIAALDANIRRYNAQIQAYSAYSSAYRDQIQALLSKIEIFKAEIEAASLKNELNQAEVALYQAQISAQQSIVELYNTQMRAAEIATQIEALKLQQYQSRIQAYISQVGAQKAQVDLYTAGVQGEMAKVDIFRSQVGAFNSQVDVVEAQTRIELAKTETDIRKAQLNLSDYEVRLKKYEVDFTQEATRIKTILDRYGADSDAFRAIAAAWAAFYTSAANEFNAAKEAQAQAVRSNIAAAEVEINKLAKEAQIRGDAAEAGVELYSRYLAAYAATGNTLTTAEEG